jgi:hypothetical protein
MTYEEALTKIAGSFLKRLNERKHYILLPFLASL